jgi:hypothetical protein
MDLLFADNVHLADFGKYFIAMVVYATVYRTSPVGLPRSIGYDMPPNTTDGDNARASMQQIAWDYVSDYFAGQTNGPQHNFAARQAIATSYVSDYYTARGIGEPTIGDHTALFTASNLTNPFYHSPSDATGYWFAAAP